MAWIDWPLQYNNTFLYSCVQNLKTTKFNCCTSLSVAGTLMPVQHKCRVCGKPKFSLDLDIKI